MPRTTVKATMTTSIQTLYYTLYVLYSTIFFPLFLDFITHLLITLHIYSPSHTNTTIPLKETNRFLIFGRNNNIHPSIRRN